MGLVSENNHFLQGVERDGTHKGNRIRLIPMGGVDLKESGL